MIPSMIQDKFNTIRNLQRSPIPQTRFEKSLNWYVIIVFIYFHFLIISRNHWTTTTHMRAIDVWVVLCYIGIFSSLMEYCGILYLTEDSESKNGNYKKVVTEENHRIIESGENNSAANPTELQNTRLVLANNIEKIARILFPVYNIFFPIIYFIVCLL